MFEINPDGQGLTKPGDDSEARRKVLAKTTNYLFDNLSVANEKFFRKITLDAITDAEYGQIQILAAANFLRYIIHTNVAPESIDTVVTNVMGGLKEPPPKVERPENEDIDKRNAELAAKQQPKIIGAEELKKPPVKPIITNLVN
jgi:hypothetical protein